MALAPVDLLATVIPLGPPISVVLTDRRSMIEAVGWGVRLIISRTRSRGAVLIVSHKPLKRHRRT
jgi:hypothetical protein